MAVASGNIGEYTPIISPMKTRYTIAGAMFELVAGTFATLLAFPLIPAPRDSTKIALIGAVVGAMIGAFIGFSIALKQDPE